MTTYICAVNHRIYYFKLIDSLDQFGDKSLKYLKERICPNQDTTLRELVLFFWLI